MRALVRAGAALTALILTTSAAAAAQESDVSVEAAVARDVVDRMPAETGTAFPANVGKLFLWTKITGAAEGTISHVWIHGQDETAVELRVGGSPWRTWSSRQIKPEWTGEWRIEVRNEAGEVLETIAFTIG